MSITIDLIGVNELADPGLWLAAQSAIARQNPAAVRLELRGSSNFLFTDRTSGVYETLCDLAKRLDREQQKTPVPKTARKKPAKKAATKKTKMKSRFPHLLAVFTPETIFEPPGIFVPIDFDEPVTVEIPPPPGVPRGKEPLPTVTVGSSPRLLEELALLAKTQALPAGVIELAERAHEALAVDADADERVELSDVESIMKAVDTDGTATDARGRWGIFVLTLFARNALARTLIISFD